MGGADTYCLLTGNRYQDGVQTLADEITLACDDRVDDIPHPPKELLQKLHYTEEDVQDSNNFVMITPYEKSGDDIVVLDDYDQIPPTVPSPSNVTAIFHVRPGDNPELTDYRSSKDPEVHYTVSSYGATRIITFSAYRILVGRFPKCHWPSILYTIGEHRPAYLEGVDQGPTAGIQEQYADWIRIGNFDEDIKRWESDPAEQPSEEEDDWYSDVHKAWYRLLMDKSKTQDEILEEAWLGKGNMYCLVRPDRFPIAEASSYPNLVEVGTPAPLGPWPTPSLTSLPLDIYHHLCSVFLTPKDILTLISINRNLRTLLMPNANAWAYQSLLNQQPYYLPLSDAPCPDGDGEIKWWKEQWKKGGVSVDPDGKGNTNIPWMKYARACSRSTSMKNRKRIWNIVDQVERIARERLLLERCSCSVDEVQS